MGVGDFVGPLVFLGVAAYGVWAFVNHQFPFNIDTSGLLGGGTTPDLSGTTDGTMMMMADPCAACCAGGTATGAAGYLSYATKKKKKSSSKKHSSKKKKSSSKSSGSSSGGSGGGSSGTDMCAGCNCGGTGGTTSGGVWGQNPASQTPCDIPNQPCSPIGSLGGTANWCQCKAAGAAVHEGYSDGHGPPYGDYGSIGALVSGGVPIVPDLWTSNYAKSGDYGAIGNLISRGGDVFRSFQGNYTDSDMYYPVQYGYLGSVTYSRLNQLAGIQDIRPTRNPLAEYVDRATPVAVS